MRASTVYAVIAIITFGVFSPINTHEFVDFGDRRTILKNEHVMGGLSAEGAAWAFEVAQGHAWQPLAWISLQASRDAHGTLRAAPWLLSHLALHIVATLLLLFALSRLTAQFWPSAFVASVYALHPLQVEKIAWATARSEALAGVFFAAALAAWALWVEKPGVGRYALVLVAALLGTLAGPGFAALPFLLLVLDVWPLGRLALSGERSGRFADRPAPATSRLLLEKAPLLLIGFAGAIARQASAQALPNPWMTDPSLMDRLALVPVNLLIAAGRVFWPLDLAFTHPTRSQMGLGGVPAWQALVAFVLIVGLLGLFGRMGSRGRPMLVGSLWFLVLAIPSAGLLPTVLRMQHDRDLGLALIGLAVMVAFGFVAWSGRMAHRTTVAAVLAGSLVLAMGVASRAQTAVWRNTNALYDHALKVNQRDAMAHYYKGMLLIEGGYDSAGIDQLERTLSIRPDHVYANLLIGTLLLDDDRPEEALPHIRTAAEGLPDSPDTRGLLAAALLAAGDAEEAFSMLDEAVRLDPESSELRFRRARLNESLGRNRAALEDYRATIELDPGNGVARARLGTLERREAAGRADSGDPAPDDAMTDPS